MTAPDPITQYLREEIKDLSAAVHDDLAATRADMTALATEVRGHLARQEPRIAVLEHRVAEAEKTRGTSRTTWLAVAVAALAWVPNLVQLLGK